MINIKKIFIALVIIAFQLNFGQTEIAKYAGEFMSIGVGARALAMGGAQVAIVNDVTSGYWNPAGLAKMDYPQVALMHDERFGGLVNYNYGSVAIPYGNDMSFGISAIRLSVDGIPDTREALVDMRTGEVIYDIDNPNGKIDPDKVKEFSNADWAFYGTFSKKQSDNFYWGANIKVISRSLAEFSALGIGFDVGALYQPMDNLYLGANLMDITTTLVAWDGGRNELISPTAKLGAAYSFQFLGGSFLPALDLDMRFENRQFASTFNVGPVSFDVRAGLEYSFQNLFMIRAGYTDVKQFTIGAGVKLPKLNIDYSYAQFSGASEETLGETHRISIMLTLEEPKYLRDGL
ncbi:MAG: PorV/PorQ family protein [Bacteroidetes bacterium]|nr:PorV/PorQ family protein [Bacteroidota bacterium]MBU1116868.1 PorV/PorQ family protein [Bacteroidota bacterium]MBU1797454.1 PorV/PorQ family protein [Bacteroidota bacterium]